MESFELSLEQLRARRGSKWNRFPNDVIPAWVADMDFRVAEPIQEAIHRIVDVSDYGYAYRTGEESLAAAFAQHMQDRFGWKVDVDRVQTVTEVVQCLMASILTFSEPGDGVLTHTPIYPPFLMSIDVTGRRLVENPLVDNGARLVFDIERMRQAVDETTKIILLCSPHNPSGRVLTREELQGIAELAIERDLIIVSDEIHADLAFPGHQHIPMAMISPEAAARTITLTSATKSFNIAGLRTAVMHFGSAELQERFQKSFPGHLLGQASTLGVDATIAAWRQSQSWLDAVMRRLEENRDYVHRFTTEHLPGIHHYKPEGTYLYWLDCKGLDLPGESPFHFFLEQARVGLNEGKMFGTPGQTCVRLNFATTHDVLEQVLTRMAHAVEHAPVAAR